MKYIRPTEATQPVIRDTSKCLPLISPADVAAALGAEPAPARLDGTLGPISLFALREELFARLQSAAGQPGPADVPRRGEIPLADADWRELERLARAIAAPGFTPSAGQVASALLAKSVRSLAAQIDEPSVARELAALTAAG